MKRLDVAVIGAGLGGLVAGLLLCRQGHNVMLYEQAPAFSRIGAGIQLGPNVLKILRRLGLEGAAEATGSQPPSWISRDGRTGEVLADIPLNRRRVEYAAAYVTIHRGDFHELLVDALPRERIRFGHRLIALEDRGGRVTLEFERGERASADLVIGADGVNSFVREVLLGVEKPIYSGFIGHRAIFPTSRVLNHPLACDPCVKWWTEDRHMMVYNLDAAREEMYFVTGAPQSDWDLRTAFLPSSKAEMLEMFAGYHPAVIALIEAADEITKWPLLTRPALPLWSRGRIVLLGDACHPMKPHMAQGAAMAIEDAAMLARCLTLLDDHEAAFALYRAQRGDRATRVQAVSNANTWLRTSENPDWVYGHDVFGIDLTASSSLAS